MLLILRVSQVFKNMDPEDAQEVEEAPKTGNRILYEGMSGVNSG